MEITYSFKKVGEFDQHFCRQYFEKKAEAIARALPNLGPSVVTKLVFRAERFAKKKAFKVSLAVASAGHEWLADEDDHTLREAIDLAKDKLVLQMRKRRRVEGTVQGLQHQTV